MHSPCYWVDPGNHRIASVVRAPLTQYAFAFETSAAHITVTIITNKKIIEILTVLEDSILNWAGQSNPIHRLPSPNMADSFPGNHHERFHLGQDIVFSTSDEYLLHFDEAV